ncbi:oligosaccharide flippase family protein [Actomonas aquatica]|uniref:Oligosaccharide flippase family protein n=1 Tax=Actomonas aquatica TaxID=2866162 RepID=A0ABZ1C510_9BACT|nr:oligosaccharide flippase family protein [Opitutus sp. WL0086]WRQ86740.1 oligosaccharide flippase family protein [Opitutus sp. WL0086]
MPLRPAQPLANTLWIVGGRVASMVVTIGVVGAIARHLGPADFGHFNAVLAFMAIAVPWATLSLDAVVVRELVRRPDEAGGTLGTACLLRVGGGLTAIVGMAIAGRVALPGQWPLLLLASLSLVFQANNVIDLWFQRHLQSRRAVISRTSVIYAGAAVKLLLVVLDAPLLAFVATIVLEAGLYAVAYAIAYRTAPERSGPWHWDQVIARRLLRGGLPLALAGLVAALGGRFDQVLVAIKLSDHAAGLYLAANRFTEFALYSGAALIASLFPALTAAHAAPDAVGFRRELRAMFEAVSALGWASAIALTLLAPVLVHLVLGPQYDGAVAPLIARAWLGVLLLSVAARWNAVLLVADSWWSFACALITVAVQVALAGWCLERWGMMGAAGAVAVGALVGGVFTTWLLPPLRPLARAQLDGLLIIVRPDRWRAMVNALSQR